MHNIGGCLCSRRCCTRRITSSIGKTQLALDSVAWWKVVANPRIRERQQLQQAEKYILDYVSTYLSPLIIDNNAAASTAKSRRSRLMLIPPFHTGVPRKPSQLRVAGRRPCGRCLPHDPLSLRAHAPARCYCERFPHSLASQPHSQ